jgi:t-SNARE complex subunit (syntaxin)
MRKPDNMASVRYNSLPTGEFDEYDEEKSLKYDRRLHEQDASLEVLGESVKRLGQLSLNISEEIDTQNRMLTKLEVDMDSAKENVDNLTERTKELVKRSGGPKMFCIIVTLTVILIVLIFLVIYT